MKLISFRRDDGDGWGVLVGGGVADLSVRYPQWPTLKAAMAGGLLHQTPARSAEFTLDEVTLLPPVPDAGWIVCVGLNYRGHIAEMGRELPAKPTLFTRRTASVVGNGAAIVRPFESVAHDYEGEWRW